MDKHQRRKLVHENFEFLNEESVRCTYGSVGEILEIPARSVSVSLSQRSADVPRMQDCWLSHWSTDLIEKDIMMRRIGLQIGHPEFHRTGGRLIFVGDFY